MSHWVMNFDVNIVQQLDGSYSAMAFREGMRGFYHGTGSTPDAALANLKNEVSKMHTPGIDCNYVVTSIEHNAESTIAIAKKEARRAALEEAAKVTENILYQAIKPEHTGAVVAKAIRALIDRDEGKQGV